jgi:UDP-glucose 4-epimerase
LQASIEVGESQLNPEKYYLNNVAGNFKTSTIRNERTGREQHRFFHQLQQCTEF